MCSGDVLIAPQGPTPLGSPGTGLPMEVMAQVSLGMIRSYRT